jgi:hypothetical protein
VVVVARLGIRENHERLPTGAEHATNSTQLQPWTEDTIGYFDRMTKLMCEDAPPAPEDAPMLARIAKIGIEPCKPFDAGGTT